MVHLLSRSGLFDTAGRCNKVAVLLVGLASSLHFGVDSRWKLRSEARRALSEEQGLDEDSLLLEPSATPPRFVLAPGDHPYKRGRDGGQEVGNEARVQELLSERWAAKKVRDYALADELRSQLEVEWGVLVWDKRLEWTVGRSSVRKPLPMSHDYTREIGDSTHVDVNLVDQLLLDRLQAKLRRNFDRADAIKDRLRFEFSVRVDDGAKTWRAGVDPSLDFSSYKPAAYRRVGDVDGGIDTDEVERLINLRHQARRRKYWTRADELLDELIYMGVVIDDDTRTWRTIQPNYTRIGDFGNVDDVAIIDRLVAKRRVCKMRRQYQQADKIREDLATKYGIHIDDHNKTYSYRSHAAPR